MSEVPRKLWPIRFEKFNNKIRYAFVVWNGRSEVKRNF